MSKLIQTRNSVLSTLFFFENKRYIMEVIYIISQIFVIIQYSFIIATYQVKTKRQIFMFNTLSAVSAILSFLCLKAYSGCLMSCVSLFRNFLFSKGEKKTQVNYALSYQYYLYLQYLHMMVHLV